LSSFPIKAENVVCDCHFTGEFCACIEEPDNKKHPDLSFPEAIPVEIQVEFI
jgi:hypothetical protein